MQGAFACAYWVCSRRTRRRSGAWTALSDRFFAEQDHWLAEFGQGAIMKTYLVGGAVRDHLLGLPVVERDWVVVGSDPEELRHAGYRQIDSQFPVFEHPETHEEYALARRETKRGPGYRGFDIDTGTDVSLEEDLRRRDLTVNAIAQAEGGVLIDPFGGQDDLAVGLLRHVSASYAEDPVRLLRTARFAAKLGAFGFRVAHATHHLMRQMVETGAVAELQRERFSRELLKALVTDQPWRFFEVLHRCGALAELLPLLAARMGEAESHAKADDTLPIAALKRCSEMTADPGTRLVSLLWPCLSGPEDAQTTIDDLRLDRNTARLIRRIAPWAGTIAKVCAGEDAAMIDLAVGWSGFGVEHRESLILACAAQCKEAETLRGLLKVAVKAAVETDTSALRAQGLEGPGLGAAIKNARRESVARALQGLRT